MPSTLGIVASHYTTGAFSPLSLSPAVWFDASDSASITASGSNVTQWSDKSGNNYHLTASGTARPSTGIRTVNSKNVIDFSGSQYMMNTANAASIWSTSSTWFTVAESDDATDIDIVMYMKNGASGLEAGVNYNGIAISGSILEVHLNFSSTNLTEVTYQNGSTFGQQMSLGPAKSPSLLASRWQNASVLQIYNQTTSAMANTSYTTNNAGAYTASAFIIGAHGSSDQNLTRRLDGSVAEVLVYKQYMSDANVASVVGYLKSKWNV